MGTYNYGAFFRGIHDLKKLHVPAREVTWTERYEVPDRAHDVVLYLGCNALRTPHIVTDLTSVFEALGIDFVAVGGQQFCCGIPWRRQGDTHLSHNMSNQSVERLRSYGAPTVVMWCPSCDVQYEDQLFAEMGIEPGFEALDPAAYLLRLLGEGRISWQQEVPARVLVHGHVGSPSQPTGQERARRDVEGVVELLGHVPGVDLAGVELAPPELSYHCGQKEARSDAFEPTRRRTARRLAETSADRLVTISHACQRAWSDFRAEGVEVSNYIRVVAAALGCPLAPDTFTEMASDTPIETLVEVLRPNWETHGLDAQQAAATIERFRS